MTSSSTNDITSRLGVYVLPGRVNDPRPAIGQAQTAEHLGFGTVWIGERYGTKDMGALAGAIGQATQRIKIGTAITHFMVRHPISLASAAMTIQALTGGRFSLGVGRSVPALWKAMGLPNTNNAILTDSVEMLRTLCRGEKVSYDGPAGRFPSMRLGDLPDAPVPKVHLAAIGPKTLALAGQYYDGAILHPFLTAEAVGRSAQIVREAALAAGRNPADVKVIATVVTAPDLTEHEEAAVVGGRAVTYFQIPAFGDLLAGINHWDTRALEKLRSHPQLKNLKGSADNVFTRAELVEVSKLLPSDWLQTGAAVGRSGVCAARLREYLDAGADELILHGSTPELLGTVLQHCRDSN